MHHFLTKKEKTKPLIIFSFLKYKLLCKKNGSCNYIYTNDLQDIIEDISEFGVFCDNTYQNINLFHCFSN